jgi:alkanesulfonate monooxygenase SsuD/methylene tetrahydromethanopterin reductase-like flavin-dependent oxidoreductase (luciferase family)
MIGGGGERKLLRLVAKYADANNLFPSSPAEVRHKLDVLARHCDEVGRDRAEIRKTTIARVGPDTDVDAFVNEMRHTRHSASSRSSSGCSGPSRHRLSSASCRRSCRTSRNSKAGRWAPIRRA